MAARRPSKGLTDPWSVGTPPHGQTRAHSMEPQRPEPRRRHAALPPTLALPRQSGEPSRALSARSSASLKELSHLICSRSSLASLRAPSCPPAAAPQSPPLAHILFLVVAVIVSTCRLVQPKRALAAAGRASLPGLPSGLSWACWGSGTIQPFHTKRRHVPPKGCQLTFRTERNRCLWTTKLHWCPPETEP